MKSRFARVSLAAAILLWPAWLCAADGEQVEGSWFPLLFYGLNFLIFLGIVRKYGWPRITQFFRDRSHTIREIRDRAEKAYREAQELANEAAERLRQLQADQHKLKTEMDQETAHLIARMRDAASEAVSRIQRDTEITRLALHDGAQRRLRHTMAEAAGGLARELVRQNFRASDQTLLLQSFVERIGEETRR
jgi:F0F1-type ATP synthase membrane subunit b/b'